MTNVSKLDETMLLPKSAFYNRLVDKELDEQFEHSKQLWTKRDMSTLRDWHHFYLQTRRAPSRRRLPGLQMHHDAEGDQDRVKQITDPDIYLMIESAICGRLSYVAQRAPCSRQLSRDARLSSRPADVAPALPRPTRSIYYRSAGSTF